MGAIENTVASGLCLGCGLCATDIGEGKVSMKLQTNGFLRPVVSAPLSAAAEARFIRSCPARRMTLTCDASADVHPIWGPLVGVRTGWSGDADVRHHGSSGGGISSVILHLLGTGQIAFAAQIAVDPNDPLRNQLQISTTRAEVMNAAGSRYAPAAPLENIDALFARGQKFAFVGKPCDVAAMRAYLVEYPEKAPQVVALLSFMCAGVPSIKGTHEVLGALGTEAEQVVSFKYRGDGWPGFATAVTRAGDSLRMDYNESWGQILGKHLQLRCKLCPDGTGEFADIVCADAWHGKDGYPDFTEGDGRSLILTRTQRGEDLLKRAVAAGDVVINELDVKEITSMQPYQVTRKRVVLGRWVGYIARRRVLPRFRQLRLFSNTWQGGLEPALRNAWGTFRRLSGSGDVG